MFYKLIQSIEDKMKSARESLIYDYREEVKDESEAEYKVLENILEEVKQAQIDAKKALEDRITSLNTVTLWGEEEWAYEALQAQIQEVQNIIWEHFPDN